MSNSSSPTPSSPEGQNTPASNHLEEDLWDLGDDLFENEASTEEVKSREVAELPPAPERSRVKVIGEKTTKPIPEGTNHPTRKKTSVRLLGSSSGSVEKGFVAKKSVDDEELKKPLSKRKTSEIQEELQNIARSTELPELPKVTVTPPASKVVSPQTSPPIEREKPSHTAEPALDSLPDLDDDFLDSASNTSELDKASYKKSGHQQSTDPSKSERLGGLLETPSQKPLATPKNTSFTKGEKLSVIALIAGILALSAFAIVSMANQIILTEDNRKLPDFPIKSERITIDSVSTSWRAPRSSGDTPDPINVDDAFIPVASITFGEDTANSTVRLYFQNDKGVIVGDPTTRDITGGDVVELAGTKGFEYLGGLNGYIDREIEAWHVIIAEVPPSGSKTAVTEIATIPISSLITE